MTSFKKLNIALAVASLCLTVGMTAAHAQESATPGAELHKTPAKQGWFWYKDPPEEKKEELPPPKVVEPVPEPEKPQGPIVIIQQKKEEPAAVVLTDAEYKALSKEEQEKVCGNKDSWIAICGFIDPGADFDFQAKQRDELLKMMSLTPDNPDAVEAAQQYMKWVVGKATMAANMWHFNMVQNPDLDPTVSSPISEVGIALATRVTQATQYEYFKLMREEGAKLFYFTRNDCSFCHDQTPYTQRVARTMGLELVNIPLDGVCVPEFKDEACGDNVPVEHVAPLNVKMVPALYMYVPSNTWIRLGSGVMTDNTILANTVNFFSAYRSAILQGLDNGNGIRPPVSFDPNFRADPVGTGTSRVDDVKPLESLDKSRIMDLMGYGADAQPSDGN